jgi:hypothetical protein
MSAAKFEQRLYKVSETSFSLLFLTFRSPAPPQQVTQQGFKTWELWMRQTCCPVH